MTAELKSQNLIKVYHRDKLWCYRLTTAAKRFLLEKNKGRFYFYLNGSVETNLLKSEYSRRIRLQRVAETMILMYQAGVLIFRDQKWELFSYEKKKVRRDNFSAPTFYNSRELKEVEQETEKIKNSRATGVLFAGLERYLVYHTGNGALKWQPRSELRMKAVIGFHPSLASVETGEAVKAIMLGNDMDTAYQLLKSNGGKKKEYFCLDETFAHMHFITVDYLGIALLKLLVHPVKQMELKQLLLTDLQDKCLSGMDYDAEELGNPVLFAYDFDMPRIVKFCSALALRKQKGKLICFDYQKEALQKYCGGNIEIQTIDFKKFEGRFFCGT